jgi:branched-subunit amino acid ABC-type transport system permease component
VKIQKIFRMHMMLAAVGAALLFAGAARAQEIDNNPVFDQGPDSVALSQPSPAATAGNLNSAAAGSQADVAAAPAAASAQVMTQASVISQKASAEASIVATMAVCIGLAVLLVRTETRRRRATFGRRRVNRLTDGAAIS